LLPGVVPDDLTETEKRTLRLLQTGPHSLYFLAHELDKDPYLINLDRLVRLGLLARASVTPTDIVHALGTFTGWNQEAAILGTKILALRMGLDWKTFLVRAMDSIINRLCLTILQSVINFEGKQFQLGRGIEAQYFIEKILKTGKTESLELSARLQYPIIGIGAPVRAYLPGVAEKLNTRLLIPDHAEVANAIGAATGKVMEKIRMLIKPGSEGGFILHSPWERKTFMYLEDAKKYALEEAKRQASLAAERAGAVDYQLAFSCEDITSGIKSTWQDEIYVETRIEVTGVGRPKWESNHQNSTKFFIT
ncbi:MAG TPA: hydantoinase/oxoprolinase family protein, partial [Clostridia bacterium]|nr:hydantoinase/oxoprolinase family protein [Clostridia bacterium]